MWGSIKDKIPKKLKLSPIAMIPHKNRKFRAILDLLFHLRTKQKNEKASPSVNEATTKLSNPAAMTELGNTLRRILARMADAQNEGRQLCFAKLDIKDGFWQMIVNDQDACHTQNSMTSALSCQIVYKWDGQSPPFFLCCDRNSQRCHSGAPTNSAPPSSIRVTNAPSHVRHQHHG